jgi:hypothetical protein
MPIQIDQILLISSGTYTLSPWISLCMIGFEKYFSSFSVLISHSYFRLALRLFINPKLLLFLLKCIK